MKAHGMLHPEADEEMWIAWKWQVRLESGLAEFQEWADGRPQEVGVLLRGVYT